VQAGTAAYSPTLQSFRLTREATLPARFPSRNYSRRIGRNIRRIVTNIKFASHKIAYCISSVNNRNSPHLYN